jgi:hypothetical protein
MRRMNKLAGISDAPYTFFESFSSLTCVLPCDGQRRTAFRTEITTDHGQQHRPCLPMFDTLSLFRGKVGFRGCFAVAIIVVIPPSPAVTTAALPGVVLRQDTASHHVNTHRLEHSQALVCPQSHGSHGGDGAKGLITEMRIPLMAVK